MLSLVTHPSGIKVKSYELYHKLGVNPTHYDRWLKKNVLEFGIKDKDYIFEKSEECRSGKFRQHYFFSIDFSKTLCYNAKTRQSMEVRSWLMWFVEHANYGV
jgi:phage anti-repressor protein